MPPDAANLRETTTFFRLYPALVIVPDSID